MHPSEDFATKVFKLKSRLHRRQCLCAGLGGNEHENDSGDISNYCQHPPSCSTVSAVWMYSLKVECVCANLSCLKRFRWCFIVV